MTKNIPMGAKFVLKIKLFDIVLYQAQVFKYHFDMGHCFL